LDEILKRLTAVKISDNHKSVLASFFSELSTAMRDDDFKSFVVHGKALSGECDEARPVVEIIIIPSEMNIVLLEKISPIISKYSERLEISAEVMTYEEILLSSDVFPVRYLELKKNHAVVLGEDLLGELDISREHLRLHCEQELRGFSKELRSDFMSCYPDSGRLFGALVKTLPTFLLNLKHFVEFKTGEVVPTVKEVVEKAAAITGIRFQAVEEIFASRRNPAAFNLEKLKSLYSDFIVIAEALTRQAD